MSVHHLAYVDQWMTREELAKALKVSGRTVDRWRQAGMPSELWGPRSGTRRYPLAACLAWARRRGSP